MKTKLRIDLWLGLGTWDSKYEGYCDFVHDSKSPLCTI